MARKGGMATGVEVARLSVKVSPDSKSFRRELERDLDKIEQAVTATINVEPDTTGLRQKIQAAVRGVSATIGLDVDRNRLGGAIASAIGDGAANGSKSFGGMFGGMGSSPAGMAVLVGAITALMAPAVGLVGSLLAGLPSLAAGFGGAAGAVALGLDGIKAAAESLRPDLDALKQSVSGVFEQRLTPMFDQLRSVFPVLESGMGSVANGVSDMLQGLTSAVTSAGGLDQLRNILGQTGAMFSQLQPIVQTATSSFLTLANAGANSFGHLTGMLGTFSTGFHEMVGRITSSGAFDGAMQGLSQTLGSILNLFTRLMESGVGAMGQLGGPLSTLVNGLGDAFIAAMPALTSFSATIANVLGTALTQMAPVVTALTPAFTQLMAALGGEGMATQLQSIGGLLTQVATALGGALSTAVQTLTPQIPEMVANFGKLAESVGPLLAGAINSLVPLIPPVVNGFVSISQTAVQVIAAIAPIAAKFQEFSAAAVSAVTTVVTAVGSLSEKIRSAVSGFATLLVQSGKDLIQGLINGITSMVGSAVAAVKNVASSVVGAVKGALGINSPSRVFHEVGVWTGEGFKLGLQQGFEPALAQAKALAGQVAEAFASGVDPTALLAGMSQQDIDRIQKALSLEEKRLTSQARSLDYQAKLTGDDALSKRADDIRMLKEQLGLQRDMLGLTQDYSDTLGGVSGDNPLAKAAGDLLSTPVNFAKSTAGQFMSDLGISGNGIISKAVTEGIQYIFQVGSMDEAFSAKDRAESKQALATAGR